MSSENRCNKNIELMIKTWNNNSDGIFHYKTDLSSYTTVNPKIKQNNYFFRKNNNIISMKNHQSEFNYSEGEILFYVRKSFKTSSFELINPVCKKMEKNENNIHNLNNRLWYVLKSNNDNNENNNEEYNIKEKDIIKLGRKKNEVIKKNIASYNNIISNKNKDNYNISEMNKKIGSIFTINIKPNQYKIT